MMEVDVNEVIGKLIGRIASLELENAKLTVALEAIQTVLQDVKPKEGE